MFPHAQTQAGIPDFDFLIMSVCPIPVMSTLIICSHRCLHYKATVFLFNCWKIFQDAKILFLVEILPILILHWQPQPEPLSDCKWFSVFFIYLCFVFCLFRAAPTLRENSQARGWIWAVAASPHHSHSNAGSKPHLQPTPQLTAMPDR